MNGGSTFYKSNNNYKNLNSEEKNPRCACAGPRHVGTGPKDREDNLGHCTGHHMTHWQSGTPRYSSETKAVGNGPPRVHSIPEKIRYHVC